jgi:hypothetical protein
MRISSLDRSATSLVCHMTLFTLFQVTDDIALLLKSLKEGEIPESWLDLCYPTMDDLDGFLVRCITIVNVYFYSQGTFINDVTCQGGEG